MANLLFALALAILPPCQMEDSTSCAWDASTSGNGYGRSFIALPFVTIYAGA